MGNLTEKSILKMRNSQLKSKIKSKNNHNKKCVDRYEKESKIRTMSVNKRLNAICVGGGEGLNHNYGKCKCPKQCSLTSCPCF